jgi:hypothetical protein
MHTMNTFVRAAVAVAVLSASAAANASTVFDFSYTFADGQEVTGSFTGTTTDGGQSVTNVSNMQASLNGIAFAPVTVGGTTYGTTPLQLNAYSSTAANPYSPTGFGNFVDNAPVTIYANGTLNNFAISDVDVTTNSNPDYEFAYINDSVNSNSQVVAANFLQTDSFSLAQGNSNQFDVDAPGNAGSWTLTEAPVPIPATLPLLASGLGMLGFRMRRRRVA